MDEQQLMARLHTLNDSEIFYRNYRLAKSSPSGFAEYLQGLNRDWAQRMELLIPEWPETLRQEYLEDHFFSRDRPEGIHVFKHNCYTPAVPHCHDFLEMFFVLEGRCIHQVGGSQGILRAGDLCLLQPKVTHALDVSDESVILDVLMRRSTFRHYFYSLLQGDNLLANFFMSSLYSKQGIDYMIFHTGGALHSAFIELCAEYMEQQAYSSVLLNAIVTKIFVLLLRGHTAHCELPPNQVHDPRTALQIARYLQSNAASATLGDLAAQFHYSPEYASRLIKQVTGQTFIQLLTSVRMENAEQLLRDTSLPIADVASAVGYESSEHFIRTFRKHVGQTPSAYRRSKAQAGQSPA